jgi:hypothetical protein
MQIGGATSYSAPAANSLPARPIAPSVSPDVSPDITRAAQSPVNASQSLSDEQSASAREEADNPAGSSASADKPKTTPGESSPEEQRLEQLEVAKLVSRDQEVRTHEQAHAAVGGRYAGAPSYTYERGPDGKRYAVGGEVGIDTGAVANDPEATLRKMEVVIRAALAPAEPSAQDRQVAAQAQAQMVEARAELLQQQRDEAKASREERAVVDDKDAAGAAQEGASSEGEQQNRAAQPSLDVYKQSSGLQEPVALIDMRA